MVKEKIVIELNNKGGQITCSSSMLKLIRDKFSVENPSYQMRKFAPRKYVITPSGAFDIGLWGEIHSYLTTLTIAIELQIKEDFEKAFKPVFKDYEIQNIEGFEYYKHQINTIEEFLKHGRGNGLLATSSGKTNIIGGFIKTILHYNPSYKFLIIVPNTSLLNQLYNSFIEQFNIKEVTRWGDNNIPDWDTNIIIANSQMLTSDIKYSLRQLNKVDVVLIDEVHCLGERKNKINKIVHNIPTFHKFGLTGTLPTNKLAAWNIVGKIGPILYEESSYNIRQKGVAANVRIQIINCQHSNIPVFIPKPNILPNPLEKYAHEINYLYTCEKRNDLICRLADKIKGNVLILVDSIDHGETLQKICSELSKNKQIYFVQGLTETDDRFSIIKMMEDNDNIITIAMSRIFSTGISVNNLPNVIFCCIGKSNIKISQSIGRSMRLHKNKTISTIYDIADNTIYSRKHLTIRQALYAEEQLPCTIKSINLN